MEWGIDELLLAAPIIDVCADGVLADRGQGMKPNPVIEILPQKSRALLTMFLVLLLFVFVYSAATRSGSTSGPNPTEHGLSSLFFILALIFLINAVVGIRKLLPNPAPRVRITGDRLDLIGFWQTKGFAWRDFGFFEVKKVSRGKSGKAVMIRAMAPGSEPTGGFVNWLGLSRGMLEFDIGPFVPLFRKSVDEGEKIANWILALRDGRDVPPPDTLIVRTTTASMSAVAKNQTVARR